MHSLPDPKTLPSCTVGWTRNFATSGVSCHQTSQDAPPRCRATGSLLLGRVEESEVELHEHVVLAM